MKNRIFTVSTLALLSFAIVGIASADTSVSAGANIKVKGPGNGLERKLEGMEKRASTTQAKIEDRMEKRASSTEKRMEKKEDRFEKRIDRKETRITKQFDMFLDHLKGISTRLSAYITKLGTSGKNVTEANASLTTANTKISLAATAVADFDAYADTLKTATETASTTFIKTFREKRQAARKALGDAEKALKDTLKIVKTIEKPAVTSTTTVNATSTI